MDISLDNKRRQTDLVIVYRRRAAMNPAPAAMASALFDTPAPALAVGLVGIVTLEPPVAEATAEVLDPESASAQI
jgi:hypothetical protein